MDHWFLIVCTLLFFVVIVYFSKQEYYEESFKKHEEELIKTPPPPVRRVVPIRIDGKRKYFDLNTAILICSTDTRYCNEDISFYRTLTGLYIKNEWGTITVIPREEFKSWLLEKTHFETAAKYFPELNEEIIKL